MSITDVNGLHRMIGQWLVDLPKPLTGAEFRFLRHEMDLSQAHLAAMLGSTKQNVQRWEKARGKDIQGPAHRLIRALYSEYVDDDPSVRRMVDRLSELDRVLSKARLRHGADWELEDCRF